MDNISIKFPSSRITTHSNLNITNNRFIPVKENKPNYGHRSLEPIYKVFNTQNMTNSSKSIFLNSNKSDSIKLHKATKSHTFKEGLNTFIFSSDNYVSDKDTKNLLSFYNSKEKKREDEIDSEAQREIFSKFNIHSGIGVEEKQNISRNLRSFDRVYNNKLLNKETTLHCCVTDHECFENPFKSYSQLKINKDIYANVVNIYANKLQKSYIEKYKKVSNYIINPF